MATTQGHRRRDRTSELRQGRRAHYAHASQNRRNDAIYRKFLGELIITLIMKSTRITI